MLLLTFLLLMAPFGLCRFQQNQRIYKKFNSTQYYRKRLPLRHSVHEPSSKATDCISEHNYHRLRYGLNGFSWDADLANAATRWAHYLSSTGTLQHAENRNAGENLYMSYGSDGESPCKKAISRWMAEEQIYLAMGSPKVTQIPFSSSMGHFSQIIWPNTRKLGCGSSNLGKQIIVVCRYFPAGNMQSMYL